MSSTFSARVAADIITFASKGGADVSILLRQLGIPETDLNREDIRIPCTAMARMWASAIEQTGDPLLALHLAEARNLVANRTTSLIMESSGSVLEAFELACKYSVLIADVMDVCIGDDDETIFIEFSLKPDWATQTEVVLRDCLNITYLSAIQTVQRMTGSCQPPCLLTFTMEKPTQVAEYYRIFDCSIQFDAPVNRIGFSKHLKDTPVVTGDAGLKKVLKRYADELSIAFQVGGCVVSRTMGVIYDQMSPVPPTLSSVAKILETSERSLQRRLKQEGTTFKELVDRARMELSEKYLLSSNRNLDEIAYLSGYADASSFVRAFRRWHGQSPRQFTRNQSASALPETP